MAAELAILLRLRDEASAAMKKAQKSLDELDDSAKKSGGAFAALGDRMRAAEGSSMALAAGLAVAAAAVAGIGLKGLQIAGNMEQVRIAMTTMLGSTEAADAMIKEMWDFAAKTPFEFTGLIQASRQLLGYGFAAKEIIPIMTTLGDAVSAMGGGEFEISRVVRALGQMQSKGKVTGEEMRQLAETLPGVWQLLADAMGISIAEAMKRSEKGMITAAQGISAILEGLNKRFAGGMEKQSQSLLGLFSTVKDNISGILWGIGDTIIVAFDVKEKLKGFIESLQSITKAFRDFADLVKTIGLQEALAQTFSEDMKLKIAMITGAIVVGLIPAFVALAGALWAAVAPLLPFLAAGAALGALAYVIISNWSGITTLFSNIGEAIGGALASIGESIGRIAGAVTEAWEEIEAIFDWEKIKASFLAVGEAIIAGIWEGIQAAMEGLTDFLFGWLRVDLPEGAMAAIGAASPAKMFIPIGEAMMDGVATGIKQGEATVLKVISDAMSKSQQAMWEAHQKNLAIWADYQADLLRTSDLARLSSYAAGATTYGIATNVAYQQIMSGAVSRGMSVRDYVENVYSQMQPGMAPSVQLLTTTTGPWRLPGYQQGGLVPGPIGSPQLAMVHGGERITPANGGKEITIPIYIGGIEFERFVVNTITGTVRRGGLSYLRS